MVHQQDFGFDLSLLGSKTLGIGTFYMIVVLLIIFIVFFYCALVNCTG